MILRPHHLPALLTTATACAALQQDPTTLLLALATARLVGARLPPAGGVAGILVALGGALVSA